MQDFRFKALDATNTVRSGSIEAESRRAAQLSLSAQGLTIIDLAVAERDSVETGRRGTDRPPSAARRWSPTARDIQVLAAEWARCLDVGLTIAQAVDISADGRNGTKLGRSTVAIRDDLKRGSTVHDALRAHMPRLPPAALSMIEAGERSGELAEALAKLAERLVRQQRLKGEIRSALIYPSFVVVTAVVVIAILLQVVVPAIDEVIGDRSGELPISAQMVLAASRAFRSYAVEIVAGLLLMVAVVLVLVLHPAARPAFDRLRLRIPVIGALLLAGDAAQFARSLGAQIGGGVPLGRAVRLAVDAVSLQPVRHRAAGLERRLAEGCSLSEALALNLPSLPRELSRFARIGEQTGRLPALLAHVADLLDERTRQQLRVLTGLVTPTVTVTLGLLVGFIVLSLMSAIIGLNEVALR
ncbi:type II secretion system F family protein [Methylobacterium mesophilicum]|uniref:type II secretion system F family protein n=1 Tax=Methylobacterium mesophilicum TaxID=39956 RepID=UPI002F34B863